MESFLAPWANIVEEYVPLSALQHIFAGLKRTRDQKLSSGLMSGQLSSAITGLMLLTFTTTHLLTSRPTLRSRSPCASWAPPLHWGLVPGSFPAPHHQDPNETLLNFQIWVMVDANGGCRRLRSHFLRAYGAVCIDEL